MNIDQDKAKKWFEKFGVDPNHVLLDGLEYRSMLQTVFPAREIGEVVYRYVGPRPWGHVEEGVAYTVRTITVPNKPEWMED